MALLPELLLIGYMYCLHYCNSMKIGVLTAMTSEFEQLAKLLAGVRHCEKGGISYLVGRISSNEIILR